MKRLIQTHPIVFLLLVAGFVFDAVLLASTGRLWDGGSFALGSTAVVVYFLGPSALLRFVIFRRRLHLALAWGFTFLLWFGWFVFYAMLKVGPFRPSLLFVMCILAAFKTMRLVEADGERTAPDKAVDPKPEPEKPEPNTAERSATPDVEPPVDEHPKPCAQAPGGSLKSLERVLCIMAAVGCLLALFDLPSEYYKVLRFVVVAACIALITGIQKSCASEKTKTWTCVGFGLLAVFYNPILPLDLDDEDWLWMNGACALAFLGFLLWTRLLDTGRLIKARVQGQKWNRWAGQLTRLEKAMMCLLAVNILTMPSLLFLGTDRSGFAAAMFLVCLASGLGWMLVGGIDEMLNGRERKENAEALKEFHSTIAKGARAGTEGERKAIIQKILNPPQPQTPARNRDWNY